MTSWHADPRDDRRDSSLDHAEVERQTVEYAATRDPALKARLVEAHQWLVVLCARRMQRRREPLEDLIQVCNVGLLEALERFDPTYGVTFRTYASATLNGVLRHHYRTTWRLRIPRRVQELHLRVSRAIETLSGDLQRSPTMPEVAAFTGATVDEVIEAIDAGANFWPLSLSYGDDGSTNSAIELVHDRDNVETVDQRLDVLALLARLPDMKRKILYMRFFEDRTQGEIAEILGLSQVSVSRTMRSAVLQLRSYGDLSTISSGV
jgi:RNA polymerase sigma-B factor